MDMEERVATLESWKAKVEPMLAQMSTDLHANTAATNNIANDTQELLKLFSAAKVNLSVLKWLAGIGAAIATIWAAVHFGR